MPGPKKPALVSSSRALVIAIVEGLTAGPPTALAPTLTAIGMIVVRVTLPSELGVMALEARSGSRLSGIGGSELAGPVCVMVKIRVSPAGPDDIERFSS